MFGNIYKKRTKSNRVNKQWIIIGAASLFATSILLVYPIQDMEAAVGNTIKSSNINSYSKYSITRTEGNVNSTSINTNDENCEKDSKCGEALDKIINSVFDSENGSEIKEGKELENALNSQDETAAELSQYDDDLPYQELSNGLSIMILVLVDFTLYWNRDEVKWLQYPYIKTDTIGA